MVILHAIAIMAKLSQNRDLDSSNLLIVKPQSTDDSQLRGTVQATERDSCPQSCASRSLSKQLKEQEDQNIVNTINKEFDCIEKCMDQSGVPSQDENEINIVPSHDDNTKSVRPYKTIPGDPSEYTPGRPYEYVPGNPNEYLSGDPSEYVPGKPYGSIPDVPAELVPGYPMESMPDYLMESMPGHPNGLAPGYPMEPVPGHPNGLVPGYPMEYVPGYPNGLVPGYPMESVPGYPYKYLPAHPTGIKTILSKAVIPKNNNLVMYNTKTTTVTRTKTSVITPPAVTVTRTPPAVTYTKMPPPTTTTMPPLVFQIPTTIVKTAKPETIIKTLPPQVIYQPPVTTTIQYQIDRPASTIVVSSILPPIIRTLRVPSPTMTIKLPPTTITSISIQSIPGPTKMIKLPPATITSVSTQRIPGPVKMIKLPPETITSVSTQMLPGPIKMIRLPSNTIISVLTQTLPSKTVLVAKPVAAPSLQSNPSYTSSGQSVNQIRPMPIQNYVPNGNASSNHYPGNGMLPNSGPSNTSSNGGPSNTSSNGGSGNASSYGGSGSAPSNNGISSMPSYSGPSNTSSNGGSGSAPSNNGISSMPSYSGPSNTSSNGGSGSAPSNNGISSMPSYSGPSNTSSNGGSGSAPSNNGISSMPSYSGPSNTSSNSGPSNAPSSSGSSSNTSISPDNSHKGQENNNRLNCKCPEAFNQSSHPLMAQLSGIQCICRKPKIDSNDLQQLLLKLAVNLENITSYKALVAKSNKCALNPANCYTNMMSSNFKLASPQGASSLCTKSSLDKCFQLGSKIVKLSNLLSKQNVCALNPANCYTSMMSANFEPPQSKGSTPLCSQINLKKCLQHNPKIVKLSDIIKMNKIAKPGNILSKISGCSQDPNSCYRSMMSANFKPPQGQVPLMCSPSKLKSCLQNTPKVVKLSNLLAKQNVLLKANACAQNAANCYTSMMSSNFKLASPQGASSLCTKSSLDKCFQNASKVLKLGNLLSKQNTCALNAENCYANVMSSGYKPVQAQAPTLCTQSDSEKCAQQYLDIMKLNDALYMPSTCSQDMNNCDINFESDPMSYSCPQCYSDIIVPTYDYPEPPQASPEESESNDKPDDVDEAVNQMDNSSCELTRSLLASDDLDDAKLLCMNEMVM